MTIPTDGAGAPGPDDARPTVSVIIPCYEAAGFVGDALESVRIQKGPTREVLVVNDGSPDAAGLRRVVARFPSVRLLDEPHRGLPGARNAGIREATAPLLAFLDADDCWLPDFLAEQVALLRGERADLVYGDAEFFGGSEKDGFTVMEWDPSDGPVTFESVLAGLCVPVMSTILARADAVEAVGGFDERLPFAEDFDLWVRMLANGAAFTYRRDIRARRRLHATNMSYDTIGMARGQVGVIDRNLTDVEKGHPLRRAILSRRRVLCRAIHLGEARGALTDGDPVGARKALWKAVRAGGAAKHLVGALALTVAPTFAVPVLRRRMG